MLFEVNHYQDHEDRSDLYVTEEMSAEEVLNLIRVHPIGDVDEWSDQAILDMFFLHIGGIYSFSEVMGSSIYRTTITRKA